MSNAFERRRFLQAMMSVPLLTSAGYLLEKKFDIENIAADRKGLKTSLNAFSFNAPLTDGSMTMDDLLTTCATLGFEAVDITGYYFKGYPVVPADDYLYDIKRKAFKLGLGISGTGVRNDFTIADKTKRQEEVKRVKQWIEVAEKIGAPVLRIFAGTQKNEGYAREQVTEWMLKDIEECVAYGKQHGVIIGLQNHNDFIQTADQVISIIKAINSDWLGIILDTGSYRVGDPYEEIKKSIPYTVNWQIKEKIFLNGAEVDTDIPKLVNSIKASTYKGYLPIETLGAGDPKAKVAALLSKLQTALG